MPEARINGVSIAYVDEGQGEPLILLHGLGVSRKDWGPQIDFFSQSNRVIAPDFRGHGDSDKPDGPYSVPIHAADVISLMDVLGIPSAHIVGLSMGGMVAFQLAVDAPERLLSMTIVNSGPALPNDTFAARKMLWTRLAAIHLLGMKAYGRKVATTMFPGEGREELIDMLAKQIASNPKKVYLKNLKSLFGWGVLEHLTAIQTPTLMLTGDRDYSPVAVKQAVVSAMQNAKLVVIADSGHGTPIEKPEETNTAIAEFIRGVSPTA
ncbi:alpha/beta hydrolase [Porticoccus litoralis]|uniref:Alpha/beta hydrolase n=1 Tax=Porticoccus litoralis TaxID=434086 RepID=A0AAW8B488_9GAMM|nr:alpha/beta hydrolase [Porticoccus litoralis]MDP1521265.1 alpha/beta hydrolase [Porticoccus litoralis]